MVKADTTICITGAANGLGAAFAKRFAATGARLVLIDIDKVGLEQIAGQFDAVSFVLDVTDYDAVEKAVAQAEEKLGPISLLINNAGIGVLDEFQNIRPAAIRRVIEVNLIGALNVAHAVYKHMVQRKAGTLVNIISITAHEQNPRRSVYGASKWGMRGFNNILQREAAEHGINVLGVYPAGLQAPHFFAKITPDSPVRDMLPLDMVVEKTIAALTAGTVPKELIIDRPGRQE